MSDPKQGTLIRNFTDGQFFNLLSRLMDEKYVGPDGIPGLRSDQLIRPRKIGIVKSAGARWTRQFINRKVFLWSADSRRVDYIPGDHPGDVSAASPSPWNSSVSGVCKLLAPGEWQVKTPLIGADVEGDMCAFLMTDAATDLGDISASEIAGAIAAGDLVNVYKIGGTVQSGVDVAADFAALNLTKVTAPTAIAVTSTIILAASATRRYVYLRNLEPVGGKRFSLAWGAAAELDKGRTLFPGEGAEFFFETGSTQEFRSIASVATPAYELTTGVNA